MPVSKLRHCWCLNSKMALLTRAQRSDRSSRRDSRRSKRRRRVNVCSIVVNSTVKAASECVNFFVKHQNFVFVFISKLYVAFPPSWFSMHTFFVAIRTSSIVFRFFLRFPQGTCRMERSYLFSVVVFWRQTPSGSTYAPASLAHSECIFLHCFAVPSRYLTLLSL